MTLNRGRILTIEDDDDNGLLTKMILEDNGYEVLRAATCAEAVIHAEATGFDLFLLDGRLGDGTGVELCPCLLELQPQTPIVFYSGAGHEDFESAALRVGAAAYLIKPLETKELVQQIESILMRG